MGVMRASGPSCPDPARCGSVLGERQGRLGDARDLFDRACACANDLGLFAEEFRPSDGEALGNFPQGLTHLSHVAAALALSDAEANAESARHTGGMP